MVGACDLNAAALLREDHALVPTTNPADEITIEQGRQQVPEAFAELPQSGGVQLYVRKHEELLIRVKGKELFLSRAGSENFVGSENLNDAATAY